MTRHCPKCEGELLYNERHDAYYCLEHGWQEESCGDVLCRYCADRPEIPPTPCVKVRGPE